MKLVDVLPGTSIWAAAEALVAAAKQHNEIVFAVFNGTEIVATPTTNPVYVMGRYTEDHEALRLLRFSRGEG